MICEVQAANNRSGDYQSCEVIASRISRFGRFACEEHASVADLYVGEVMGDYCGWRQQGLPDWLANEEKLSEVRERIAIREDAEKVRKDFDTHCGLILMAVNSGTLRD